MQDGRRLSAYDTLDAYKAQATIDGAAAFTYDTGGAGGASHFGCMTFSAPCSEAGIITTDTAFTAYFLLPQTGSGL